MKAGLTFGPVVLPQPNPPHRVAMGTVGEGKDVRHFEILVKVIKAS